MVEFVAFDQVLEVHPLDHEHALSPHHFAQAAAEVVQVGDVIEHRCRGDHLGADAELGEAAAGGVIPELLEHGHALVARDPAGPLGRVDAEHAHALLGEHPEQRAVVAADVDHQVVRLEAELVDHAPGELLEMRDDGCIDAGEVRVISEQHVLRGELGDLDFPAVLADHHRQREADFAGEIFGGEKIVAVGLVAEVDELGQPRPGADHALRPLHRPAGPSKK